MEARLPLLDVESCEIHLVGSGVGAALATASGNWPGPVGVAPGVSGLCPESGQFTGRNCGVGPPQ